MLRTAARRYAASLPGNSDRMAARLPARNSSSDAGLVANHPAALDTGSEESIRNAVKEILLKHKHIDVLVNNAGIAPRIRPQDPDQMQKWDQVVSINLTAQWDITVALLPGLKHPGASVVFLSSIAGFSAPRSSAAYGATKAAIRSLVQYFARDLGPTGGRANGLAPGRMKSDLMTVTGEAGDKFIQRLPLGRVGETEEIVGPALFLASDMSSYVTGVTIPVDGGYLAL